MDLWKLNEDELTAILGALQGVKKKSKQGTRLTAQLTELANARERNRREDAEWEQSQSSK